MGGRLIYIEVAVGARAYHIVGCVECHGAWMLQDVLSEVLLMGGDTQHAQQGWLHVHLHAPRLHLLGSQSRGMDDEGYVVEALRHLVL